MILQFFGILILLVAGAMGWLAMNPELMKKYEIPEFVGYAKSQNFSEMVSEDFSIMREKKLLPEQWDQIQYVAYGFNSEFQKKLINDRRLSFPEKPSGTHRLQVEFIDAPDDENPSIILQLSLFEIGSENKIWETAKTYSLVPYLKPKKKTELAPTKQAETATAETNSAAAASKPEEKKPEAATVENKESPASSQ